MADEQYSDDDLKSIAKQLGIDPAVIDRANKPVTRDDVAKSLGVDASTTTNEPLKITVRPKFNQAQGLIDQVGEGMPIIKPLIDKAASGIAAIIPPYGDKNFDERYDEGLSLLKDARKAYQEENPGKSLAANVVGSVIETASLPSSKFGRAVLGMEGPTLGIRSALSGVGQSVIGATDAALRGESISTGAGLGFAGGVAGPLIGEGIGKGIGGIVNQVTPKAGPIKNLSPVAINKLTDAFAGETPISIAASRKSLGPNGMLGDITQGTRDITAGLAAIPGESKVKVRQAYLDRIAGQRNRITQLFDKVIGPTRDLVNEEKLITDTYKKSYDPLYEQFRSMQVHPTDEIKALIPRLKSAGAFKMAEELSGISGNPVKENFFTTGTDKGFPTTESWNYIKQGLDRRINQAYNQEGGGPLARELVKLKQEMMDEVGKTPAGKVWAQAREKFAEKASLIDQLSAGKDTFLGGRSGTSVDELREELKTLSKPELMARIQGLRNAADEAMGNTLNGDSTLRNKLLAPNNKEKMKLLLGGVKADDLVASLENEKTIADLTTHVIGNPNTGASNVSRQEQVKSLLPTETVSDWDLTKPMTYIPPSIREQFTIAGMHNAWKHQKFDKARNQLSDIVTMPNGPQIDDLILSIRNEAARQAKVSKGATALSYITSGSLSGPGTASTRRQLPVE